jgi:hypothetical protein
MSKEKGRRNVRNTVQNETSEENGTRQTKILVTEEKKRYK